MITLQITNLSELKRGHEHFLAENQRMIAEAVDRGKGYAKEFVERYPGFKPRTGNLQKKTGYRVVKLRNGKLLTIENDQKYANSIDGGARAHPIEARNAPYLHFFWKKKNRWVRTKRVNHPGIRPYKTFYRAAFSTYRLMGQHLEHRMKELAQRF